MQTLLDTENNNYYRIMMTYSLTCHNIKCVIVIIVIVNGINLK